MLIFLVGMPCSGKSNLIKHINDLNQDLITLDLDNIIEHTSKSSITALFQIGASHFRDIESQCLKNVVEAYTNHPNKVIVACGGGTPCYNNNMEVLLKNGLVVWLDAPEKTITKCIIDTKSQRPLLNTQTMSHEQIAANVNSLLADRIAFFQQAHIHLPIVEQIDSIFAQQFINHINNYKHE